MGTSDNFYLNRRSVLARKMQNHPIKDDHLDIIVKAGIRVPDHGALNPWKIKIIKGDKLKITDEQVILPEFKKENPKAIFPELRLFPFAISIISDAEQSMFNSSSSIVLFIINNARYLLFKIK